MRHSALILAAALPLLATPAARAADATQAQAADMEAQIRQGIVNLMGPDLKLPPRPVQVTPAGDHYDLTISINPGGGPPLVIMGRATQAPSGTWAVSGVSLKVPAKFQAMLPDTAPGDTPPGTTPTLVRRTFTVDMLKQDGQIAWDPSFATASTWSSSNEGLTISSDSPVMRGATAVSSKSVTTMQPAGPDRSDLSMDGSLVGYSVQGGQAAPAISLDKVDVAFGVKGMDRARGAALMRASVALALATSGVPAGTPPDPALVQPVLAALQGFASSIDLKETVSGLKVSTGAWSVGMQTVGIGLGGNSSGGLLTASLDFAMDGLTLPPDLVGPFAALVPQHVSVRPSISGINVAALRTMADQAMNNTDPTPESIGAFFANGGIAAAVDSLGIDVGGASFAGSAKVTLASPSPASLVGTGQVTARNLDALTQKVSSIPELAQAMPILVIAKGMGRADGDKLVWDVSYAGGKLLVNNIDVLAMAAGGPPPGMSPTPAPAPLPPPTSGGPLKAPPSANTLPNWAK